MLSAFTSLRIALNPPPKQAVEEFGIVFSFSV